MRLGRNSYFNIRVLVISNFRTFWCIGEPYFQIMTKEELYQKTAQLPETKYWNTANLQDLLVKHAPFFRKMVQNRIDHCEKQLNAHLHEAKSMGQIIIWEGGHFAIPVWEQLVESKNQYIQDWNALVWEQIIRQMGRENEHFDAILWDIASEGCMCCINL